MLVVAASAEAVSVALAAAASEAEAAVLAAASAVAVLAAVEPAEAGKDLIFQLKVKGRNDPYDFDLRCVLIPVIDREQALSGYFDLTYF